jgi:hypothetical protein
MPRAFSNACAFKASVWRISSGVAGWCVNAAAGIVPARANRTPAPAMVEHLINMVRLLDRVDLSVSASHETLTLNAVASSLIATFCREPFWNFPALQTLLCGKEGNEKAGGLFSSRELWMGAQKKGFRDGDERRHYEAKRRSEEAEGSSEETGVRDRSADERFFSGE